MKITWFFVKTYKPCQKFKNNHTQTYYTYTHKAVKAQAKILYLSTISSL